MRLFIYILFAFILFACADLKKSDQLNRVKILCFRVDSLFIISNQINDPLLKEEIEENKSLIWNLTERAKEDTITETEARLVDEHINYVSKLSSLKLRVEKLNAALKDQKIAIQNLTKDIENGSGKRDLYDENWRFEQKKINLVEEELNAIKTKKSAFLNKIAIFKIKSRELNQKLKSKQITK